MFNSRWILASVFLSFQVMGAVSMEEKISRVEYLEELTSKAVSMNIDAYRRDLKYEEMGLSLDERAMNEANLLAERIRVSVHNAYEAASKETSPNEALAEVRSAIEKDLELVSPELRDEIRKIALDSLENINSDSFSTFLELKQLETVLLEDVKDRSIYLNSDRKVFSTANSKTSNIKIRDYKDVAEVISSLTSDKSNDEQTQTATITMRSAETTKKESSISLKVSVDFLGVSVSAGPSISFRREFKTNVTIQAEGLNPVLQSDGAFDYIKRDGAGKIVTKNGQGLKRIMYFTCDASLNFETDYAGGGGFSFAGMGAGASLSKKYTNAVVLTSRRIHVPETIGGKVVTIKDLADICHMNFLNAKISEGLTVSGSLNIMMKNVVSTLRFSHPKTKCIQDSQCYNWFNREIVSYARIKNFPRCVEEKTEKYRTCEVRGLVGQNCTVYDSKGKRVSDGSFEFICDTGLTCVKTRDAGWFRGLELYQHARGSCQPIDPKTYRQPLMR